MSGNQMGTVYAYSLMANHSPCSSVDKAPLPSARPPLRRAAGRPPRRLGVDTVAAQLLGEGIAPALHVGLVRVQTPPAVARLGGHAQVRVLRRSGIATLIVDRDDRKLLARSDLGL